ncbi:MAG: DUF427 domain-containing protein, partial [Rhodospirillaceae bacterium]|nr:DUF427 domain-containing protein [Rhodospirillaceae bacterium]
SKSPGFEKHPGYMVHIEKSPRRVRVEWAGEVIADSTDTLLVRESNHVPVYYFARDAVRMDLLSKTEQSTYCPFKSQASYWSINVGGESLADAVWSYEAPFEEVSELKDYFAFYWNKMDRWLEEDEEIYVHPRDPYKRVDAIKSSRNVRVELGGETIAESSDATFVFETGMPIRYYLPMDDVKMEMLIRSDTSTRCPYKGQAFYWSVNAGGHVYDDIVWGYRDPLPEAPKLKNQLCFFNENVDAIYIDGEAEAKIESKWSKYLAETLDGPEHIV